MNKIIKDTAILTIITLVAGLFLGIVYEVTKGPIEKQEEKAKQEAYLAVFDGASEFKEVQINGEEITWFLEEKGIQGNVIDEILSASNEEGKILGYVMQITSNEGYAKEIIFSIGIQADGTVNGIQLLSISETAGLGMKAKEPAFKDQFAGKKTDAFIVTKEGAVSENEIDAISGATITTNAMVNGVNAGLCVFQGIEKGEIGNE